MTTASGAELITRTVGDVLHGGALASIVDTAAIAAIVTYKLG